MDIHGVSVGAAWEIAKTAGEISKKLYDFGKNLSNKDEKHQVDQILDQLRELKQSASELEDENRELREKLRFKSDDYEWHAPFWYAKDNPNQALCPRCFANKVAAPMGDRGQGCSSDYRLCLVCRNDVEVSHSAPRSRMPSGPAGY